MSGGSENEPEDFASMIGDVVPMKNKNYASVRKQLQSAEGLNELKRANAEGRSMNAPSRDNPWQLSLELREGVDPFDQISFKRPGVQHGVFKKLRMGDYPIVDSLDLHGKHVDEACAAVQSFLKSCHDVGHRCVLISHGKGARGNPPALLKSLVNQWLPTIPLVLAFHSAQSRHGGVGAVYILLKKRRG